MCCKKVYFFEHLLLLVQNHLLLAEMLISGDNQGTFGICKIVAKKYTFLETNNAVYFYSIRNILLSRFYYLLGGSA